MGNPVGNLHAIGLDLSGLDLSTEAKTRLSEQVSRAALAEIAARHSDKTIVVLPQFTPGPDDGPIFTPPIGTGMPKIHIPKDWNGRMVGIFGKNVLVDNLLTQSTFEHGPTMKSMLKPGGS